MNSVASLSFMVIITYILVAKSSCKRAKYSSSTTVEGADIDIASDPIRHHRSGHQDRAGCRESSQCGNATRFLPKLDPKTSNSSSVEHRIYYGRIPPSTNVISEENDRVKEQRTLKKATKKGLKKLKKGSWRERASKNQTNALQEAEFLNRPQNDGSNNVVQNVSKGIPESQQPSNSTFSAGCVNKPENITMCTQDIPTIAEPIQTTRILQIHDAFDLRPSPIELYREHHAQIYEHFCKKPIPELVLVSNYHPNQHRVYSPAYTVLHQCRSPCCDVDDKCVPHTSENVSLYFKITTYFSSKTIYKKTSYEYLHFVNHTSCRCYSNNMAIMNEMNEIQRDVPSGEMVGEDIIIEDDEEEDEEEMEGKEKERRMKIEEEEYKGCGCVLPFVENAEDGPCSCDCNKEDVRCAGYKLGTSFIDRGWWRCVKGGKCAAPECQYGDFLTQFGRCPKKKEYLNRL